jgi:hypothetical protein
MDSETYEALLAKIVVDSNMNIPEWMVAVPDKEKARDYRCIVN